jgi:DNA-directed RNA polymerase subunit K/omega
MTHMDETTRVVDPSDAPDLPTEPAAPIDSRFLFVDIAALRAKQLRRGARPRFGADGTPVPHKAERVAMEEVKRGLVPYEMIKNPVQGEADV